ncbi:MAG: signal peptidase I [Eubacterium sp.]|nr:signal peptidase I [Eubacterium sp.]
MKRKIIYLISLVICFYMLVFAYNNIGVNMSCMYGESNYPTIKDGSIDVSIVTNIIKNNCLYEMMDPESGTEIVKRVVAVPGDTVEFKDEKLYINGVEDSSPFSKNADYSNKNGLRVVVPENEYFVLGDNRNVSIDSRYFGTVPEEYIISKVLFTIY